MHHGKHFGRWAGMALILCGLLPAETFAVAALKAGLPISAYSASLFGRKNLNAQQRQILACDPADPTFGSTSVDYDIGVVKIVGFGFGPGYQRVDAPSSTAPSGAHIEVIRSGGLTMVDLQQHILNPFPGDIPTGYVQAFWELVDPVNGTGGSIPNPEGFTFLAANDPLPGGVDTHFFEFEYLSNIPDTIPASYRVYDSTIQRGGQSFAGRIDSITVEDPNNPGQTITTAPGSIVDAVIFGTIPEPRCAALALVGGTLMLVRRWRHAA
jgi:hypothetical protein